jgi:hypothetical protein
MLLREHYVNTGRQAYASTKKKVTRPLPSHGVLVVPLFIFLALAEEVLFSPFDYGVWPRSATRAVVGCLSPRRPGVDDKSR